MYISKEPVSLWFECVFMNVSHAFQTLSLQFHVRKPG